MDANSLLESFGYLIIFVSIFLECGVLLGLVLPLPSFSLLLAAGVFATTGKLDLWAVIVVGVLGAVLGYVAGYYTGLKYGRKLFYERKTEKYFTEKQGKGAEKFMKKYGYSTLIVGRWLPIIHSVAPIFSGIARTPLVPFIIANIVGAIAWVASSTYIGYFVGQNVPNAHYYILPVVFLGALTMNTPWGKRIAARVTQRIEDM